VCKLFSGGLITVLAFAREVDNTKTKKDKMSIGCWGRGDEVAYIKGQAALNFQRHLGSFVSAELGDEEGNGLKLMCWDEVPPEAFGLAHVGEEVFRLLNGESLSALEASGLLRREVAEVVERLQERSKDLAPREESYLIKLKVALSAWHACEMLMLDPTPLTPTAFSHWVHFYFKVREVEQELDVRNLADKSQCFWDVVNSCAFCGDLLEAWDFLQLHSRFRKAATAVESRDASRTDEEVFNLWITIREMLLCMPRLVSEECEAHEEARETLHHSHLDDIELWRAGRLSVSHQNVLNFKTQWTAWNQNVRLFLKQSRTIMDQIDDGRLTDFIMLVSGDDETINRIRNPQVQKWPHLLCARLTFVTPVLDRENVISAVDGCFSTNDANCSELGDELLHAVFQFDAPKLLHLLHSKIGERWVLAHLADLLARADALESLFDAENREDPTGGYLDFNEFILGDLEVDLREYFILEYASQLGFGGRVEPRHADSREKWAMAATYLSALDRVVEMAPNMQTPLGLGYMEEIIDRYRPKSDDEYENLINACATMGINAQSKIKERLMFWWNRGRGTRTDFSGIARALNWAHKFELDKMARKMIKRVFAESDIAAIDSLAENLESSVFTSGALDDDVSEFLSKHRTLLKCLKSRSNEVGHELISLLTDILETGIVPVNLRIALLQKVLLESDPASVRLREPPLPMTILQSSVLMRTMEEVYMNSDETGLKANENVLASIRLALVQGLARAPVVFSS